MRAILARRAPRGKGENHLTHCGTESVDQDVHHRSAPRGHKSLMKFINGGPSCRQRHRGDSPLHSPARTAASYATDEQKAQDEVLAHVPALSDQVMRQFQSFGVRRRKQPVKKWNDEPGGVLCRKRIRGEAGHQQRPDEDRPPPPQPLQSWFVAHSRL